MSTNTIRGEQLRDAAWEGEAPAEPHQLRHSESACYGGSLNKNGNANDPQRRAAVGVSYVVQGDRVVVKLR